jgi:hypothetical protein
VGIVNNEYIYIERIEDATHLEKSISRAYNTMYRFLKLGKDAKIHGIIK